MPVDRIIKRLVSVCSGCPRLKVMKSSGTFGIPKGWPEELVCVVTVPDEAVAEMMTEGYYREPHAEDTDGKSYESKMMRKNYEKREVHSRCDFGVYDAMLTLRDL